MAIPKKTAHMARSRRSPPARARPRSRPPLGRSNGGITKPLNRLAAKNVGVSNVLGSRDEGLTVAGNEGKEAAIMAAMAASSVEEFNGCEATGMLLEQEKGSSDVWNDNAVYSEEDGMVLEVGEACCMPTAAGHAYIVNGVEALLEEDDLLDEEEAGQGDGNEVPSQNGNLPLDDPLSFPPLHGGHPRAPPLRAETVTVARPSSTRAVVRARTQPSLVGDDEAQGSVRQGAKRNDANQGEEQQM